MRKTLMTICEASIAQAAVLLVLAVTLGGPGCGCGTDVNLSDDACSCVETLTFESSPPAPLPPNVTLVNLVQDPITGTIGFGPTISTFPSVFMAASARDTIVRIDVNTGVIVGEYRTGPQSLTPSFFFQGPSRTTVDKFGECWVGNRDDCPGLAGHPGSVTRIGIVTGGTRYARTGPSGGPYTYTPSGTGEFLQGPFTYVSPSVVDRDGDGYIRTSYGLPNASILDWDAAATGGNDAGGVSLADDEVVVNFTRVVCSGTRGLAIDCENDLWVGGTGNSFWQEVSGTTGVAGTIRTAGSAYGGAIDANGVLWSVGGGGLFQHDIVANSTTLSLASGIYGIAIDPCTSNIWTSGTVLRHWNPNGTVAGTFPWGPPSFFGHGLCVDLSGDVWVAGWGAVRRYDSAGTQTGSVTAGVVFPKGTAVDQNGKIWVADLSADQAVRVDPLAVPVIDLVVPMGAGAGPYNYSDMTGLAALSSCGETGYLIATHNALCPGTDWGRVTWQSIGTNPNGCTITAEVRASDDPLNFSATWTPVPNGMSFCGAPPTLGQYVQVRITILRPPGCPPSCDPRLTSLQIECCDALGVDSPPNVTIGGPYFVPFPMGPVEQVDVSGTATDPDGDPLQARWFVNGVDMGPAVLGPGGQTNFSQDFPDGITEVALTATDGRNVVTAKTTVMVGDHQDPVVTCPSGPPVQGGQIVVRAFETPVPDLVAGSTAVDNLTPSPAVVLSQSPPAGTLVQQGTHIIAVTATDQAGNAGACTVHLRVDGVVAVAGVANYQIFAPMSPILVSATYSVPAGEIVQTTVLVDGGIVTIVPGVLVGSIDIAPLPVGGHEVRIEVTNPGLVVSRSAAVLFQVQ